jgi:CBS-domain-containing membrane protein
MAAPAAPHVVEPPRVGRPRYDARSELLLAAMPTLAVLIVFGVIERFTQQRLLFGSLASSAFLIYLDPQHASNQTRTLIISQLAAALVGFAALTLLGAGYPAAAVAMVVTIGVMVALDRVHPPAVATSLAFAFKGTDENNIALFGLSVGLIALLVVIERWTLWQLARAARRAKATR